MFYGFKASSGLILLILLAIIALENRPINKDKTNIGRSEKELKVNLKPTDKRSLISRLAIKEITNNSTDAITTDNRHWIIEW